MTATLDRPITTNVTSADRPRVAMVSCALPPRLDGIGDYSTQFSTAFASWADVSLHTVRGTSPDPLPNVSVKQSFDISPRSRVRDLFTAFDANAPDWLILQYNPFCFGKKGFNPYLAGVLKKLKRRHADMKLVVMVHERFMPGNSPRNAIMFAYQYQQFTAITALADLTLFSTGPWFEQYRRWHPNRRAVHMPVGSNLPYAKVDRDEIRRALKVSPETILIGNFGGYHPSRLFETVAAAARAVRAKGHDVCILSIGSAGPTFTAMMPDIPVIDLGKLPADEVSKNLQAIDIYCSPFFDGVSTRRGSFFGGLQQGIPIVTTRGYNTDADLLAHSGKAFLATAPGDTAEFVQAVCRLADDPSKRHEMARQSKVCFDQNYALPVLASRWHDLLFELKPASAGTLKQTIRAAQQ